MNLSPLARAVPGQHYLLDARNHGKSFHSKGMDYKTQAADIINFMDKLEISKSNVIGHSMGGKTAMALACTDPQRVDKLCIMDIAPFNYNGRMGKYYSQIQDMLQFIKHEDIRNKSRKEIEIMCHEKFDDPNLGYLISSNLKGKDGEYEWRIGIDYLIEGFEQVGGWEELEKNFDGPALALVGENSVHTVKSPLTIDLKQRYSRFRNIKIEIIKNAGHFIHVDNPVAVKEALNKFLGI